MVRHHAPRLHTVHRLSRIRGWQIRGFRRALVLVVVAVFLSTTPMVAAAQTTAAQTTAAQSSNDGETKIALLDAIDLLSELEVSAQDLGVGETVDGQSDPDIRLLLGQGPEVLRRLYQQRVDVPPLARLALSGDAMVDLDAAHAADSLPIVFATAAAQLDELAEDAPEENDGALAGQGLSLPFGAVVGLLAALALPIGAMSWFRRRAERMEALSFVDPLTGLANRRRLDQDLAQLDAERTAARQPVSVAMVDVDEFKRFNDTFGHAEGDRALQNVSTTIAAAVRPSDSVYRYGGEEFLVLLRNAPQNEAVHVCEGIRLAVAGLANRVTVSIGVATGNDERLPILTDAADEALYRAKADGRNRIVATSVVNRDGARVSSV